MAFDEAQLRRLDLTLLLVFEAAMASGTLSAAARRVGLTPSAVSHAVGRLREVFQDELFVRTPRGVRPTPRALALRAPLAEAVRLIEGTMRPARFDPAREARAFRIGASDYETALFAPLLLDAALSVRFVFRTLVRRAAIEALLAGDLDLLLGYTWERRQGCEAVTLFTEDYRVVARLGHPALDGALDLERYARFGHVLVSPGGTLTGIVDTALAEAGAARRVVLAVPYFLAALATVARTDLLATVPSRVALAHAAGFGLGVAVPPLGIRRFPVQMVWNRRLANPGVDWLRERIEQAARGFLAGAAAGGGGW